jgi:hypothetical protein
MYFVKKIIKNTNNKPIQALKIRTGCFTHTIKRINKTNIVSTFQKKLKNKAIFSKTGL